MSTCPGGTLYTIRAGDTFFLLAQRFGTTVAAIQAANPGVNPNNLQIGQIICIPGVAPPPGVCPTGTFAYVVRAGDTFFLLAQRFGTTVAAIQAANPTVNPNNLQVGQTICIPGAAPPGVCPTGTFAYLVQAGDTFFLLAQRFGTTVAAIQAANPTVNPNNLQIGQTLCIPGAAPPPTVCPAGSFAYVVRVGDTLFLLAQRFGTTVAAIQALNPTVDPNDLIVGSTLCIPGAAPPVTTCPAGSAPYTIQAGDTLATLAVRFQTTVAAILAVNPGLQPENLRIGQVICIPVTA
ncbi:MAG: LysM peptidoglycan-binding domain-containing protein [Bacillota bacterium]|nr:LysM peptidoglycan-binding domain-containing protein [Bacillota bacterium]